MFVGVGEVKAATQIASTSMNVAQVADKLSDVAKVKDKVSDVSKVADKAVDLGRYQASLKGLGKKLAQNIDDGILTQGRALSDSIDNLISAMNKHTSTPYPAYAGLGKLDDVGKTADKFEDWYSSVKKSMMKTDSTGGSGVKVSGPVDELNPKALNEAGEQIAKGADKSNVKNIEDFIAGNKNFDDVLDDYAKLYSDRVNSNSRWQWDEDILGGENLTRSQKAKIKERAVTNGEIVNIEITKVDGKSFADFKEAGVVRETVKMPEEKWLLSDKEQFKWLDEQIGGHIDGYTWHHSETPGEMQLVPFGVHNVTNHNGGRTKGMWADAPR